MNALPFMGSSPEQSLRQVRGKYSVECGQYNCQKQWSGMDIAEIARSAAWHFNTDHSDDLHPHYPVIDRLKIDEYHFAGNKYTVERVNIHLTSFDILERFGSEDGFVVPSTTDRVCDSCVRVIPDERNRIENNPDDRFDEDWTCRACVFESNVERREEENHQLSEFVQVNDET